MRSQESRREPGTIEFQNPTESVQLECIEALGQARREVASLTALLAGSRELAARGIGKDDLYRTLLIAVERILTCAEAALTDGLSALALRLIECGLELQALRGRIDAL